MKDNRLESKVATVGVVGAVVTILVWILSAAAGVQLPEPVVAAVTTVLAAVAAFLAPHTDRT